ncbi:MAG: diaminopimelate decarboxylase [Burkholderiales bacterium]|nr:diaminopimelate decarboxylase [Burkholderiales bacterium]
MMYKIFNHTILNDLAKTHETPCYIYDSQLLNDSLNAAKYYSIKYFGDNVQLHYALKANDNTQLLGLIQHAGLGIDCVSGGEIEHALHNHFTANHIVFAGVGKQDWEINLALIANIYAFNCESIQEVGVINALAYSMGKIAKIMLRVNPDINAQTHKHISTGMYENKFGITFADVLTLLPNLKELKNIQLIGLHYHIGSQINNLEIFRNLGLAASQHYQHLSTCGYHLTDINLGGGLGIDYIHPEQNPIAQFDEYFAILHKNLCVPSPLKIHFELGRSLVAQCGGLLSKVLFTKITAGTNFAIIDAGMNDLMRPMLYEAVHKILPLTARSDTIMKYHIVGPVCESTDIFVKNLELPTLERGDALIIFSCGAYGRVLANQYNKRSLIKEFVI